MNEAASQGGLSSMLMFGALFVMMYFMMIRPQSKRAKEHKSLLEKLSQGDEVLTQGGLVGKIGRDSGNFVMLINKEGAEFAVQKQAIVQLLPKGTLDTI